MLPQSFWIPILIAWAPVTYVVLAATFRLRPGGAPCLTYPEIARQLVGSPQPTLAEVRAVVLATRRGKSMLLDPTDENGRSCGSFFLNPELSPAQADALAARAAAPPPRYALADGRVKVPAAWLIEKAGFSRGQRFGNVLFHFLAVPLEDHIVERALLGRQLLGHFRLLPNGENDRDDGCQNGNDCDNLKHQP